MKILYALDNPASACTLYRVIIPARALKGIHEVEVVHTLSREALDNFRWDLLMLQRSSTNDALALVKEVHRQGVGVGYDIDDDIFTIEEDNPSFDLYLNRPDIPWSQLMSMRFADALTVSTKTVAKVYSALNARIAILPNCVDLSRWQIPIPALSFGSDKVVIVWAGSPTHSSSLNTIEAPIRELCERYPQVFFVFMGMEPPYKVPLPSNQHTSFGMSSYNNYQAVLKSASIGIAPLASSVFNKSKSDLRIKEYASAGLAIVASDFGPYASASQCGQVAASPEQWVASLAHLIEDAALRQQYQARAAEWIRTWDIKLHAHLYDRAWTEIAAYGTRTDRLGSDREVPARSSQDAAAYYLGGDPSTVGLAPGLHGANSRARPAAA